MRRFLRLLACLIAAVSAYATPRNVLLIITDQQSADALSCRMGNKYLNTPAMDRLAARGTFFTRAYAANPLCMPSRNAMFTGRYPHQTGVTDNSPQQSGLLLDPAKFPTLGTYFQRAGYDTAYFGKWHLCYDRNAPATHGFTFLDHQQRDATTADDTVRFLQQPHERPFLAIASFLNPHNICEFSRGQALSNGPIGRPPPPDELPPPPANLAPPHDEPDTMAWIRRSYYASPMFPVGDFTPADWQRLRWGYYRLIEKVDAEIGRVLAALRAGGLDRDTVIVFLSDHGEMAGAHGFVQKTAFYEEAARVPLIVCEPGQTSPSTSDRFVNTGIDLLPTLLDCAGIATPDNLPGRSVRPLAEGRALADWPDSVVVENNMTQGGLVDGFVPMSQGRMVRTARYKYCVYQYGERRESLIDEQNDPGELHDLARDPTHRAVLLEMRERLRKFGATTGDALVPVLLANDVGPRSFPHVTQPRRSGAAEKAARDRAAAEAGK